MTSQQPIDPSVLRGLTSARLSRQQLSRRQLLRGAGAGAGAFGLAGLLAACGVKGTTGASSSSSAAGANAVGSTAWWAKQTLNKVVNFGNWPLYIDVTNGKHPTLEYFTQQTGIKVNYSEPIDDNDPFYAKIRPSLQAGQYVGYDMIVMTNNSAPLGYLIANKWLIPLDHSAMPNFDKYAGPLVKNPSWDPGNKYTMAWQSGWTAIGYNATAIPNPGDSIGILFDKKYAGKVGMMSDPDELGSAGLLAIGVDPATSTESDWHKAATFLKKQKSDGIVRNYYDQSYIDALKNGDILVSQAWSGDIFQANLSSTSKKLKLLIPAEGGMFWTDNMCMPVGAKNPKDAMTLMDFYYQPDVQAVVEYYDDYVCPVPAAKQSLLNPTGFAKQGLAELQPDIGLDPSVTANAPTVFPTDAEIKDSRNYYEFKSQEELDTWNSIFEPITEGS